jgi:hypothetical protein
MRDLRRADRPPVRVAVHRAGAPLPARFPRPRADAGTVLDHLAAEALTPLSGQPSRETRYLVAAAP